MRLLYLTNTRFPSERAHAIQIAHTCQAFEEESISVTLITNNRDTSSVSDWIGFSPRFEHIRVRHGLVFVPYSKTLFLVNNFLFLLFTYLRINFKIFDRFYVRDEWLAAFLSFFTSSQKIVWESHEAKYNLAARHILKRGIRCVCISEGIRDFYIEKSVPAMQLLVAHDAVDDSFFNIHVTKEKIRTQLKLPLDSRVAMYIGGFDRWKGTDTFFAAGEICREVMFVAIGGTTTEIQEYRRQYPHVIFLGPLPYQQLPIFQQAADVLVIPNSAKFLLSARYTSPLKLFTYMTACVPIVASKIPSLEIILRPDAGFFFTPDDPSSLAQTIRDVFSNVAEATACAKQAYTVSLNHTWAKRASKIKTFIEQSRVL